MMKGLADRLRQHYPDLKVVVGSNDPAGWDVVVNTTPLGMKDGDPLPMDVARIAPSTFVGEVVMKDEVTPFLAAAQARGCETQVGVDMLFEQIPAYLEFFGFPTATPDELRAVAMPIFWELSRETFDCIGVAQRRSRREARRYRGGRFQGRGDFRERPVIV
jgi:shikimate dehydrogenase